MKQITSVTRRDIIDTITNSSINLGFGEYQISSFCWYGVLSPVAFLERLYKLEEMPSLDSRYGNAKDDIWCHTIVNPNDYPDDWIFSDQRFPICDGSDEDFLSFICEMFHPEVRNEKQTAYGETLWETVWTTINKLLSPDGYSLVVNGNLSGRILIGWVNRHDLSQRLNKNEIMPFISLLNRGGYVLNFSKGDFDAFTKDIVGFGLCSVYHVSMGKSLARYIEEGRNKEVKHLLKAFVEYYETSSLFHSEFNSNTELRTAYERCKEILDMWLSQSSPVKNYAKELETKFSSEYMSSQISLMLKTQKDNPTEAIGKTKELIESCCKTILEVRNEAINKNWTLEQLVFQTVKLLKVTPKDIPDNIPAAETMRKILGNLKSIAAGIAELRNTYGSGHGKPASYKGLEERHAKLAIGSATTLVDFLWETHLRTL